jgi:phage terminase small subunit
MVKSGPENPQTTEVVPFFGAERRLRPPDSLPDAARRAFINVVSSHPASHFKAGDLELVCRYAEAAAVAEEAAFQMAQPGGMVTVDGKLSPWVGIHQSMTKSLNALALRLRLGPQSRAFKQSKKAPAPVSAYDRMRMEADWDKFPP